MQVGESLIATLLMVWTYIVGFIAYVVMLVVIVAAMLISFKNHQPLEAPASMVRRQGWRAL